MKTAKLFLAVCCFLLLASSLIAQFGIFEARASRSAATVCFVTLMQDADKLVYADFETKKDNRPASSRGGWIQINSNQESPGSPNRYKEMAGVSPPAPDLVRLSRDSPNKAATFDYSLLGANQWAGVGIEIHGSLIKTGSPPRTM